MLATAPKYNDPNKVVTINSQIVLKVKNFLEIPAIQWIQDCFLSV